MGAHGWARLKIGGAVSKRALRDVLALLEIDVDAAEDRESIQLLANARQVARRERRADGALDPLVHDDRTRSVQTLDSDRRDAWIAVLFPDSGGGAATVSVFDGDGNEFLTGVVEMADGSLGVVGNTIDAGLMLKLRADGSPVWSRLYDPGSINDELTAICRFRFFSIDDLNADSGLRRSLGIPWWSIGACDRVRHLRFVGGRCLSDVSQLSRQPGPAAKTSHRLALQAVGGWKT